MFTLIESKEEIAKVQRKLEATIRRDFKKRVVKNIGYPGGTEFDASVVTDGAYWYWSSDLNGADTPNPRRLNWFGLFRADGLGIELLNSSWTNRRQPSFNAQPIIPPDLCEKPRRPVNSNVKPQGSSHHEGHEVLSSNSLSC